MEIYSTPESMISGSLLFSIVWALIGVVSHEISFSWYKGKLERGVQEDMALFVARIVFGWLGVLSIFLAYKFYKELLKNK